MTERHDDQSKAKQCIENRRQIDGPDIEPTGLEAAQWAGNVRSIGVSSEPERSPITTRYMEISHLFMGDYQIVSSLAQFESEAAQTLEERAYLIDDILDRFARLDDTETPIGEPGEVAEYMAEKLGMPEDNDHIIGLKNFLQEREALIKQIQSAISTSLHPSGRS